MKSKMLTDRRVKALKPEPGRNIARDVPDGAVPGLSLVVQPSGRKSWSLRYRFQGRQKRIRLGRYPMMSLAKARKDAIEKLEVLDRGEDPGAKEEEETSESRWPDTFEKVAAEFVERYAKRNRSWKETERILQKEAVSRWKSRPIEEIGRADVLRLLDGITDRGAEVMANRTHAALGKLFNWAVDRGILDLSPMAGLKAPAAERSRERVLTDPELSAVWRAAGTLGYPYGPFVKTLILTLQRRGELAGMTWEHVDFENALWTQPRTKAGRVHDVPLSAPALEILEALPRFEGPYVFTTRSGKKPLGGWSKFKDRLDRELKEGGHEVRPWTVHDLRRTAATGMAAMNVPPHVLAAILNHSPGRTMGISAVYIRHRYLAERREALEAWATHLVRSVDAKVQLASMR